MTRHLSAYRWLRAGDGGRLAYRIGGSDTGESILLLHGMASRSDTWDHVAGTLARAGRRVIVPDLRGHGRSTRSASYPLDLFRADVFQLLDHLEIGRTDLIGHSLGAHVGLSIAAEQPGRIRRLVIEETPVPPRDAAAAVALREELKQRRPTAWSRLGQGLRIALGNRFDWRMTRPTFTALRNPMPEWWNALPAIQAPTLLLGGLRSHINPTRLQALAAIIPDARICLLDGSHRLHSETPQAFLEAALPFLLERVPEAADGTRVAAVS